ncbi:hypothetical protein BKA70DRAFT_1400488 [Coprinopsis sp. MPI-PUGE-AT-0042]|nr:hypothetical protein BKA70DRAFT_1400488 [Coprinopsis sp. MPI-PUGE-AT-0042]
MKEGGKAGASGFATDGSSVGTKYRIGARRAVSKPHPCFFRRWNLLCLFLDAYAASIYRPVFAQARVLGVEVGSGYLVSVLHHLSVENLRKDGLSEVLEKKGIEVIAGDGREGYYQGGPYDAIHVGARAPSTCSAGPGSNTLTRMRMGGPRNRGSCVSEEKQL